MIRLNIDFSYEKTPLHFDFHIKKGETVALIGESGAGKSTLLGLIAGFYFPQQGDIFLNGEKMTDKSPDKRPVSMLFQENNLFPQLSCEQNLNLGLSLKRQLCAEEKEKRTQMAKAVGLFEHLGKYPSQLSGGQKQRLALARCLLRDKPILLLDEPLSSLDPHLRREMGDLILNLCRQKNITLMMATHHLEGVVGRFDRIINLSPLT